jgi:predicted acetyltransferase
MDIRLMVTETPDAAAALWRFALQHDLVDTVTADLRPLDDPLPWLVADPRGVTVVEHDHGWLRILDLPAALRARTFSAPLDVVLRVDDPLGFTTGDWHLRVDADGNADVARSTGGDPDVTLSISALSSLYAGAMRAGTLRGAGRISADAATAEALDRALVSFPAPTLDIWY